MDHRSLDDWLSWLEVQHSCEIDLGLSRISIIKRRMGFSLGGDPACLVITIAGTNGKGSSGALLESILVNAGLKVGLYSSPHLIKYNERIRINKIPVDEELICKSFLRINESMVEENAARLVDGDCEPISLSYFEFGTLAALDIFSKSALDVVILEVGLGGRLDAVNIIDTDCALITSVSVDHQDWLGNTREEIGYEKAGIVRANIPVVFGEEAPPKSAVNYAHNLGAQLYVLGRDFRYINNDTCWAFFGASGDYHSLPFPGLKGDHQIANASAVIQVLQLLDDRLNVDESSIRKGIAEVTLSGRIEIITGDIEWIIDVSHNIDSVSKLNDYLNIQPHTGKTYAIFGLLRRKDLQGIIKVITETIDCWLLIETNDPDSYKTKDLMIEVEKQKDMDLFNCDVLEIDGMNEAIDKIKAVAQSGDRVLVFGSFKIVEAFKQSKII